MALMILDSISPCRLKTFPRFTTLVTGKGEFVNGVRLVYPMEDGWACPEPAENKFFSRSSWLKSNR
ncbi:MAG: hypothetical protein U0165_02715 [Polyangiaceae bacterium]